jgi:6-phospho-beta-glucosidase
MLLNGLQDYRDELQFDQIVLLDIDTEALNRITAFMHRSLSPALLDRIDILPTTDHREAIEGSDFIVITIRVGGMAARVQDEKVPMKYGILGDETIGPGGFSNALRTIPVLLDYAREIEQWAPEAWVIPFSNPEGLLTEAISRNSAIKVIGLCTAPFGMKQGLGKMLDLDPDLIELDYFGVTHTAWLRGIKVDGRDMLPTLLEKVAKSDIADELYPQAMMQAIDMYPAHWLYTLAGYEAPHWYYHHNRVFKRQIEAGRTRGEELIEKQGEMLELLENEKSTIADLTKMRGHQVLDVPILSLLSAIANDKSERHVVDIPCGDAVQGFPPDMVLEIPARIDASGAHPIPVDPLPAEVRGLVQMIKSYEELAVRAAVGYSYDLALRALIAHPLVLSYDIAIPLLHDILIANKPLLPDAWHDHIAQLER